jgi:hypothetical protein
MFMKYIVSYTSIFPSLFPLLFPLFSNIPSSGFWDIIMKDSKSLRNLKHEQLPKELLPNNIRVLSKYAFGILDGDVWRIDLEKVKSNIDSLFKSSDELNNSNFDEISENWYEYFGNRFKDKKETYDHLIILLLNPYKETINELFKDPVNEFRDKQGQATGNNKNNKFGNRQGIWKYDIDYFNENDRIIKRLELQVLKKNNNNEYLICKRVENIKQLSYSREVKGTIKIFNHSDIILKTELGLFIYHFNEITNSISLIYFYHIHNKFPIKPEIFSESTLPLPNYNSFKLCDEWASFIKDNKECLFIYGVELLTYAIKEHKLDLVDEIYNKCLNYFKEDSGNNRMFLSIITSTMPLLNEYYPEYILRYSLETTMIIDSAFYRKEYQNINLHLHSFRCCFKITDITQSIWWLNYCCAIMKDYEADDNKEKNFKLRSIHFLIILFLLPILSIYLVICYVLLKLHIINDWYKRFGFPNLYFFLGEFFSNIMPTQKTPTIVFMNPYIKFVNYPKDYNWFLELIWPQPSPFVKTINRNIYSNWNGEVLVSFKWNTYGKYYYAMIWIGFLALLGCFSVPATVTDIDENVRNRLLIATIILGFIHLSFEVRQILYDPVKWIRDFWNIFGKYNT